MIEEEATRGGMPNNPEEEEAEQNFIIWFACPPNRSTKAKSNVSIEFFKELKANANPANGEIILPDALSTWTPGKERTGE